MSPAALKRALDPAYIGSPFAQPFQFFDGDVSTPMDLTGRAVVLFLDKQGLPDAHHEITGTIQTDGRVLFSVADTSAWIKGDYSLEVRLDGASVVVGRIGVAKGAGASGSDMVGAAQPPTAPGVVIAGSGVVQVVSVAPSAATDPSAIILAPDLSAALGDAETLADALLWLAQNAGTPSPILRDLIGGVIISSVATGALSVAAAGQVLLSGAISSASSATGSLTVGSASSIALVGSAVSTSSLTGAMTVVMQIALAGTASGSSAVAGSLSVAGAPNDLLMSNRLNLMGWSGYGDSSGTDTDSNTRLSLFNQTGAAVTKAVLYWANWRATATNEVAGPNTITITASVEYPAGTFQQVTFGGSTSTAVVVDELKASDELAFTVPIPSGAQYWVRTYVSVGAGLKWPLGYLVNTARGEAADFSTGADRTLSGTITNAGASATRRGFGPIGMKATGFVGAPVSRAFATIGDSFGMQAGDGNFDAKGSGGWNGRALTDKYPHVNFAISGTKVADNLPANFTRRKAALDAFGVTDIICTWGHNDLAAGRSVAQIQADFAAIWAGWSEFRIHHTTSSPRVTGTYLTAAGQTVATTGGGFAGGVSSRRHLLNLWLRTIPTPLSGVVDLSNSVDVDDNNILTPGGGKWLSGNGGVGSTNVHVTQTGAATDSTTGDGTHANVTGTNAPFYGGHFVFKDVLEAYLA